MENVQERVAHLERALEETHSLVQALVDRNGQVERRLRFWRRCAGVLALASLCFLVPRTGTAGSTAEPLEQRVAELEHKLAHFRRAGDEVYITGANLHIRNGQRRTDTANGLGNLIVGYNEFRGSGETGRSGSHNLVVGNFHNYTHWGGLIGGQENAARAPFASVTGGRQNIAGGPFSSVSGGLFNRAAGNVSTISGGHGNRATGFASSISGGGDRGVTGAHDWRAGSLIQGQ